MRPVRIGEVAALFRYPVKSMAGEHLNAIDIGWHGLDGDRRVAVRRLDDRGGFPWLTASRLPELLLYTPVRDQLDTAGVPGHVRTPDGQTHDTFGPALAADLAARHGAPVELMYLNRGIFDEASVSVICEATIDAIGHFSGQSADVRRFRPNILVRTLDGTPFAEDAWVGHSLSFGGDDSAAILTITNWDERCAMVSLDPDTAAASPEVLRAIVRERQNKAGVYAAVTRRGRIRVGDPVFSMAP